MSAARRIALAAAASLGVLGVAVPVLAAGPAQASLGCRLYFGDIGAGQSPTTWNDTFTLTATASAGSASVTFKADAGPLNGPVPLGPSTVPVRVVVALSGAQEGTVTLNQANYPAADRAAEVPLGPVTATGTFTPTAAGTVTLTVRQVVFANTTATTYCSAGGDRDHKASPVATPIVETLTVTTPGTPSPSPSLSPSPSPSASPSPSPSSPSPSPSVSTSPAEVETPPENFGPKQVTMQCRTLSTIRDWTATHTLTMSPANPGYGATVTVTYKFDNGGRNGPAPIAAGDLRPTAKIKIGGAQTGTLALAGPAYGAIDPQATVPGASLTGQFTATTPGLVTLTVSDILFDHPQVDTECNGGADPVESPKDTTIVARFTVRSSSAPPGQPAPTLPKTGGDGGLPVLVLWGSALLLLGVGAVLVVPAARRRIGAP
ncbi:hypothetical protein ABZS66_39805 [Dactylosporangium sp. NPDC005572]|uniref:hypothetical protein n=1 Tax=Dactylosporangium sp. NPDC005572 TaxID=3156889 RepID=UPI00339EBE61